MPEGKEDLKSMVDLLRQGAILTELPCPACSSPLFRFKSGDLYCAQCQKRVIVIKGEKPLVEEKPLVLNMLESSILTKIQEVNEKMKGETDLDKLQELNIVLSTLLDNLERVARVKRRLS